MNASSRISGYRTQNVVRPKQNSGIANLFNTTSDLARRAIFHYHLTSLPGALLGLVIFFAGLGDAKAQNPQRVLVRFPELDKPAMWYADKSAVAEMEYALPPNFHPSKSYPIGLVLNGLNGAARIPFPSGGFGKELLDRGYVLVSFSLFREQGGDVFIDSAKDAAINVKNWTKMLDRLRTVVPNIDLDRSLAKGYSNGAHAITCVGSYEPHFFNRFKYIILHEGGMVWLQGPSYGRPHLAYPHFTKTHILTAGNKNSYQPLAMQIANNMNALASIATYVPFDDITGHSGNLTSASIATIMAWHDNPPKIEFPPAAVPIEVTVQSGKSVPIPLKVHGLSGQIEYEFFMWPQIAPNMSGTAPNLVYTAPEGFIGARTFQYRGKSGNVTSMTAMVRINVVAEGSGSTQPAQNRPPVINTPPSAKPASVVVGNQTVLHVSVTDPDGDTLSYSWSVASRPAGSKVVFSSSASQSPSATFSTPGNYTLNVTIRDGRGGVVSGTCTVSVVAAPTPTPGQPGSNTAPAPIITDGPNIIEKAPGVLTLSVKAHHQTGMNFSHRWELVKAPQGAKVQIQRQWQPETDVTLDQYGTYTFRLTLRTTNGGGVRVEEFDVEYNQEKEEFAMEAGQLHLTATNGNNWREVLFDRAFENPVVILSPVSFNDPSPAVVRARNVNGENFQFQIERWDYLQNVAHPQERLHYLAVEQGNHVVDGVKIEAGVIENVGDAWRFHRFQEGFFDSPPVVLVQVVTENETSAVTPRVRFVRAESFSVLVQEQESGASRRGDRQGNSRHAPERIHYIAIERGNHSKLNLAAGVGTGFQHQWKTLDLPPLKAPFFFATMQTSNGMDTAALRYRNLNNGIVQILVQEEQSRDLELQHEQENVGWLLIGN